MDPHRHLDLEGSYNIRDLGGYPTLDGRQTQWRRFLRSDCPNELTPAAQTQLVAMGLRTVVDLRRGSELALAPSVFATLDAVTYHHLDMIGEGPIEETQPLGDGADRIAGNYCLWLDHRQPAVRTILGTLAAADALPALFNCAAGKDRTGVTAALLLGLVGVADEIIAEDYGLSAQYLVAKYVSLADREAGYGWRDYQAEFVPPEGMLRVLAHLHDDYGGIEAYVRTIGVTDEELARLRTGLLD